jgi:hypothetical protein
MKNKTFKVAFLLLLGGILASCGANGTSSGGNLAGSFESTSIGASSLPGGSTSVPGGNSSSGGGTSSPSGPTYPDQSNRGTAIKAFQQGKISIDINKLLGVSFTQGFGRKTPDRNPRKAAKQSPRSFSECLKRNEAIRHGLLGEGASSSGDDGKVLVSTKDYTFTPSSGDPDYYTGIKPDGSSADSLYSSPIYLVKSYGDTIEAMAKGFVSTNPYIDYKTRIGNDDFLLHYDPASKKSYLLINDRDYSMTFVGLVGGQQWHTAISGRVISVTLSFDESGKEIMDAQAFSSVTYSDNFKTLFPQFQQISTVFGAIHFEEGKTFDYLDQTDPLVLDTFSINYDENHLPHALLVSRAEDTDVPGRHYIQANLLSPIDGNGFIDRQVTSWYHQDGTLYEQNAAISFFDKNLRKQFDSDADNVGKLDAQTFDLAGWKNTVIKDGQLYKQIDGNGLTRAYHHAEKMIITDSNDQTHEWLFNSAYASDGLFHQPNENYYGYVSVTGPTELLDFQANEFSTLSWASSAATASLEGAGHIERFASAIGQYGYQLYPLVPSAEKAAFYTKIDQLMASFRIDLGTASWENTQNILRFGMDDLLARRRQAMITLSMADIAGALDKGFKDPSTISASDAGSYQVNFTTLVFPTGATVRDFLASISVDKVDLSAPDIALGVDNLKRISGDTLVAVNLADVLADQETYDFRIVVNKVTLYEQSVTVRLLAGNGYSVAFATDRFIKSKTVKDLLSTIEVTNLDTGIAEEPKLENLFRQTASSANPNLTVLSPVTDSAALLVDGETYVYSIADSTGKIIGSSSVTLTVVAVPYRLSWGDTSALSSASTIRDLLACVITTKLDPAASDVTTVQVMLVTATKVTYFDGNLDGNLISGMTYVVSVGDHGLIYDMVSITIA